MLNEKHILWQTPLNLVVGTVAATSSPLTRHDGKRRQERRHCTTGKI